MEVVRMVFAKGIRRMVKFFYELGCLRFTLRTHYRRLLTRDFSDNIASHSFRVGWIAWFLAKIEGANSEKSAFMGFLHDIPETRTGDTGWVERAYVLEDESRAAKEQFETLPFGVELLELIVELSEEISLEAKVAKDADRLDQLLLLKEYEYQGNREARAWLHLDNPDGAPEVVKRLETEGARKLAREILSQNPSDWWQNLWVADKNTR